jgi:hypothetical protein
MKIIEPTLRERTAHLYRQLLLLQHLFQVAADADDADWLEKGDRQQNIALCIAIREMLRELTEHARVLTSIPMPIGEWRPGDGAGDERWRPLTELERREILALLAAYEGLVSWSEQVAGRASGFAISPDSAGGAIDLRAERAKIDRFRQEMAFLERRRGGEGSPQEVVVSSARGRP